MKTLKLGIPVRPSLWSFSDLNFDFLLYHWNHLSVEIYAIVVDKYSNVTKRGYVYFILSSDVKKSESVKCCSIKWRNIHFFIYSS